MSVVDISIVVLLGLFAATAIRGFDLGLGALAAAFFIGLASDLSVDDVTALFPGNFFVLIVGVTALFAVAHMNGTLDWMLDGLLRLARGRVLLVVLVPFVVGAVLTAIGTLPAAATAIVAPIALGLAARYALPAFLMALVGIMGILSGLLSPLAVYGNTARELGRDLDLQLPGSAPVVLLLGGVLAGAVVFVVSVAIAFRRGSLPSGRISVDGVEGLTGEAVESTVFTRTLTLLTMATVVVLSVGFDTDIGYLGVAAACLLLVILRMESADLVARIPWGVVLLIGGILTYVGVMQQIGAFERISDLLRVDGSPALSLLVLCYIAGITSFAASSIAVFATTMPLVPAIVAEGASPVGAVLAIALASVLVDVNPLGITGGLILGAAEPEARPPLFRQLLTYGLISVLLAPLVAWAAFGWW